MLSLRRDINADDHHSDVDDAGNFNSQILVTGRGTMQIKSILAGAAIALAAATSSASAGDEFSTLGGVSAESLSSVELAAVVGTISLY